MFWLKILRLLAYMHMYMYRTLAVPSSTLYKILTIPFPFQMNQSKTALNCSIPETMPRGHMIIPHDSNVIRPIERDPPYHEDGSVPLRESGEGHPLSPSSPLSLTGADDADFEVSTMLVWTALSMKLIFTIVASVNSSSYSRSMC